MRIAVFLSLFLLGFQVSTVWGLSPEQWFQEGNRFSSEGRFEEAAKAYQKSISANPLSPVAHYNLGIAYKNLMQLNQAAKSLEKAV